MEFNRNAVVAHPFVASESIPHIFLIPFDLVLAQQRAEFVLKSNLAMMLFLPGDVFFHLWQFRLAHREIRVAALPFEVGVIATAFLQPEVRDAFQFLQHEHFCSQTGGEAVSFASMSIEQVESAIREMPPEDRRRLLLWLDEHRYELFAGSDEVTEAQKTEVLRRRQEYFDQPERFTRVTNEQELDRFFEDIRREVQARLPSARPA